MTYLMVIPVTENLFGKKEYLSKIRHSMSRWPTFDDFYAL